MADDGLGWLVKQAKDFQRGYDPPSYQLSTNSTGKAVSDASMLFQVFVSFVYAQQFPLGEPTNHTGAATMTIARFDSAWRWQSQIERPAEGQGSQSQLPCVFYIHTCAIC